MTIKEFRKQCALYKEPRPSILVLIHKVCGNEMIYPSPGRTKCPVCHDNGFIYSLQDTGGICEVVLR